MNHDHDKLNKKEKKAYKDKVKSSLLFSRCYREYFFVI